MMGQSEAAATAEGKPFVRRLLDGLVLRKWLFWAAAVVLCALDLWSKDWAQQRFGISDIDESRLEESIAQRKEEYRQASAVEIEWLPGALHFRWAENKGAAFSIASGQSTILVVVGVITLGLLLAFVYRLPKAAWGSLLLLGVIAGGAAGNIYDRLTFRAVDLRAQVDGEPNDNFGQPIPAVRDFLYWPFDIPVYSTWGLDDAAIEAGHTRKWPVFNIADIGVTGGVIGLLLITLFASEPKIHPEPAAGEQPGTSS